MARTKEFQEDQALDKAIAIFWHKGYNGTSAQDLVTHLGLSRSSLYDTFGDKKALFVKALERYQKQSEDQVRQLFAESHNVKETLKAIFEQAIQESLEDRITKGCFMVNTTVELAMHDQDIEKLVQRNQQRMESIFTEAVQKGQESGHISQQKDAKVLARFLFNNYSGIRVLARSGETKKQVFEDVVKMMLSVLE